MWRWAGASACQVMAAMPRTLLWDAALAVSEPTRAREETLSAPRVQLDLPFITALPTLHTRIIVCVHLTAGWKQQHTTVRYWSGVSVRGGMVGMPQAQMFSARHVKLLQAGKTTMQIRRAHSVLLDPLLTLTSKLPYSKPLVCAD